MIQRIAKAFVVGAGAGLIGEICLSIVKLFTDNAMAATMISVILFGVVAMILIATGIFNKIAAFGGDGASIAMCGLMHGAAMGYSIARKAGLPEGKALWTGFWGVFQVLGSGFVIAFIFGLIFS